MKCACKRCGEEKPIAEFNKNIAAGPLEPWNIRCCKTCSRVDYSTRYNDPEKKEKQKAASRNWKENNRERHAELAVEYRARHKDKITAQNRLNYAVRTGKIQRQPCQVCGATERIQAHHVSYKPEDWYNVRWLCQDCHELVHSMTT